MILNGYSTSYSDSNSKFIKSPASGSSDLIYNSLKSNKTTYKSYNNIMMKKKLIEINNSPILKSNPKNCYGLLYISCFTARLKTESVHVALFFVSSLIREL